MLLAEALEGVFRSRLTAQEREWMVRIEALRGELDHSREKVTVGSEVKIVADVSRAASRTYPWALLLFKLIRSFRPSVCVELGTCLGTSAAYQAAALKLNGNGSLVTLEGVAPYAELARRQFESLGLDNVSAVVGPFSATLDDALAARGPVDFAFIDADHKEDATLDYFRRISRLLSERAVLVFDDISWSDGMKRAWRAIEGAEDVTIAVDLSEVGVCVIERGAARRTRLAVRDDAVSAWARSASPDRLKTVLRRLRDGLLRRR